MPRTTLAEKKAAETQRLSSNFQTMIEHYFRSGRTEREHKEKVNILERILHDLSKRARLAAGDCPRGYVRCADGGCVPASGGVCPPPPPPPVIRIPEE